MNGDALARALDALLAVPERLAALEAEVRGLRAEVAAVRRPVPALGESPDDLLTTSEAAEVAGVKAATVAEWARSGRLRAAKPPGSRHYRIRRADLAAFLRGHPEEADIEAAASRLVAGSRM